jgi:hypothetical protein
MLVLLSNRNSPWTASKLPQWLGDRSYSLYLWHWPVYVALVYVDFRDNPWAIASALLLTVLLGHLSYVWVENTSRRFLERQRMVYAAGSLVLAAVIVAMPAIGIWKWQGIVGRFAPNIELAAAETDNLNPRRNECHPMKGSTSPSCVYGGTDWKVIAVGDSHANALITSLAKAQQKGDAGVVEWSYSACPFVHGLKITPAFAAKMGGTSYRCSDFLSWATARLDALPTQIPVVIIGRYAQAAFGGNEDRNTMEVPLVYFSKIFDRSTPEFLDELARHITQSACQLAKHRTVFMVRPIPEMGFDVPKTLSRRMIMGMTNDLFIPIDAYRKRNAWVWAAQDAARDQCGIKILDPIPYLCQNGRCYGSKNGRPLYRDDDHLSESGNKLLVPMFAKVFKSLQ